MNTRAEQSSLKSLVRELDTVGSATCGFFLAKLVASTVIYDLPALPFSINDP